MFCLEFILVTATVDIVQWYSVCVEYFVDIATVDIVQWYCVLCVVYCVYSNSRYSAKFLCSVWSLLWLPQQ